MEEAVARFGGLCAAVHGGGTLAAQQELLAFRSSAPPAQVVAVLLRVIGHTRDAPPTTIFEALSALEHVMVRQDSLPGATPLAVYSGLLDVAAQRYAQLPRGVTRKMLHTAATVYKRFFQPVAAPDPRQVDFTTTDTRESLWLQLGAWLAHAATLPAPQCWTVRLLALELTQAVLKCFVVSCPAMGLDYSFHYRCHCAFEELYLNRVYSLAKQVLELCVQGASGGDAHRACLTFAMETLTELFGCTCVFRSCSFP